MTYGEVEFNDTVAAVYGREIACEVAGAPVGLSAPEVAIAGKGVVLAPLGGIESECYLRGAVAAREKRLQLLAVGAALAVELAIPHILIAAFYIIVSICRMVDHRSKGYYAVASMTAEVVNDVVGGGGVDAVVPHKAVARH